MTPEEERVGGALGAGWTWEDVPWPAWKRDDPWAEVVSVPGFDPAVPRADTPWRVYLFGGDGDSTCELGCSTPDAAVAVAHLLVAAERIAAGAEVAPDRSPRYVAARHDPLHGRMVTLANRSATSPACARRDALDLLRAADEAEAQQ